MAQDFAVKSFRPAKKLKQAPPKEKSHYKSSRGLVFGLFFLTIGLSWFFWQKEGLKDWWENLFEPATYEIINPEIIDSQLIRITRNLNSASDVIAGIKELTSSLRGTYGVYVEPLNGGEAYGFSQDEKYTAASVNKIFIMAKALSEIDKGIISFDDEYRLQRKDIQDYGTGSMRYAKSGTVYSYNKLLELSGKQSDNTAAWVLTLILGKSKIQDFVGKLGMEQTSIEDNTTTPFEAGRFFAKIYKGEVLPDKLKEKFYGYLANTDFEDRISKGAPSYILVAHKIGNEIQTINDCGIVFNKKHPYVICILSKEIKESEAMEVLPKISSLVWAYENSRK